MKSEFTSCSCTDPETFRTPTYGDAMHTRELTASHCATCEVDLTPRRRAAGFCCTGCESGGPCTCSYDDVSESGIPMSDAAHATLQQELARTGQQLAELRPDANAHALEGLAHGEHFLAVRRQHALRSILDRAVITPTVDRAALGATVRYREGDASTAVISLVAPADAEPAAGRISVTSPMGAAMLGRRAGDVVRVRTPGGVRVVSIVAIG